MKVFFVSFEVAGIYKTGGLGDVAAALPMALKKVGVDVSIVMPGYNEIRKPVLLPCSNVPVYYIKDHLYFDLTKKYTHAQNFERYFYFCQKCVELIEREKPDVVHLNDWHTGMIAYLLKIKNQKSKIKNTNQNLKIIKDKNLIKIPKIILTIHNAGFQGDFSLDYVDDFKNKKIQENFFKLGFKKARINFLKLAIDYADFVNTVSQNYAKEMLYKGMSYGSEKNLRKKGRNFIGILNGIDYRVWNPKSDHFLEVNYNLSNWQAGKKINKVTLQRKLHLPINPYIPMIAFIARLYWQKGIEKIIDGIKELSKMDLQLIILGKGDKFYAEKLKKLKDKYEDRFLAVRIKFDERLAHQIYAGSDLFLIPSRYEPCGLTQMIAMRYGTVPVARKTGGLVDTITDGETGFLFGDDTPKPMLRAIKKAVGVYYNWVDWKVVSSGKNYEVSPLLPTKSGFEGQASIKYKSQQKFLAWEKMVERGMREDFCWERSARKYLLVYRRLLKTQ